MRKNKSVGVIISAAIAASAQIVHADTDLFSSRGDFGGSASIIVNGYQGFVGGDLFSPIGNLGPTPTPVSLQDGQEVGYIGWGASRTNGSTSATTMDSKGDIVAFLSTSLGDASPATNGIGHYADDVGSGTDNYGDGYPTFPAVPPPGLPTVSAPFNASGSDPYLGRSYAGNSGTSGSMVVENYQPFNGGTGPGTINISTAEMVAPNTTFPGATSAAPTGIAPSTTAFLNTIANSYAMAIDFTAPGGGTTLTLNGTGTIGYFLLGFSTADSSTSTPTSKAGGFNTGQYDFVNPSATISNRDVGSQGDQPGSFVVQHGTGPGSYWTAYIPYGYTAAAAATFFQMQLNLNMDHFVGGNVTIDNIRTVSPTWAASGGGSWNTGGTLTPDTNEIQGTNGTKITSNINSEEELLGPDGAGNWIGAQSTYVPTTFTGEDADMNGVTQTYGLGVPDGSGANVTFGDLISAPATVTLDGDKTVGTLNFNNSANAYTIAQGTGGNLVLDNGASAATINDQAGTHSISAPMTLNSNTTITVTNAADALNISGALTANNGLTIAGAGTVNLSGVAAVSGNLLNNGNLGSVGNLSVTGSLTGSGSLLVGAASGNPSTATVAGLNQSAVTIDSTGTLVVGGGSSNSVNTLAINGNGKLDITNGQLLIDYGSGSDPITQIRQFLISGYNGGTWTGPGIDSSNAAGNGNYGIGYADGADGVVTGLSSGQIEVKYTLLGDANLDGIVSGEDFTILVADLGTSDAAWDKGDFLYTGSVTGEDFTALVSNLGRQANGGDIALPASDLAAIDAFAAANGLMADVPEPASAGLLAIGAMGMLSRRRRR